jgi:secreted PhoX family phosphatase
LGCPDNLLFDRAGNLWVTCDVSSASVAKGIYEPFGNNGLFYVPTSGSDSGEAFQFASGPVEAELTGACFNENEDTLFVSVQHPGEMTSDLQNPTSHWPTGSGLPKPSVVAIRGF